MTVNICGIPHKVIQSEDNFNVDTHFGQISYPDCGNYLDFRGVNADRGDANYCPNCGAKMDKEEDE